MATASAQPRTGKAPVYRRVASAPMRLTQRDVRVLVAIGRHRWLSADQLRRLVLRCGPSMTRRRLRALYDHGWIERVRVAASPALGVPPFVYVLTYRGAAALPQLAVHVGIEHDDGLQSMSAPSAGGSSLRLLHHRFLVNEFHVVLEEAVRGRPFSIHWRHEEELLFRGEGGGRRAERVTHSRLPEAMTFLPDAYFELRLSDGGSFAFFVEVDRATHPQGTWRDRARLYAAYADPAAGLFRRRFGRETFRLAILTTCDYRRRSRCDNILSSIQSVLGPTDMFLGTTFDALESDRILGRSWRVANDSGRLVSLLDNAAATRIVERRNVVVVRPTGRA